MATISPVVTLAFGLCVVLVVINFFWGMNNNDCNTDTSSRDGVSSASSSSSSFQSLRHIHLSRCSAEYIVAKAYQRIYQPFVDSCPLERPYSECIENASQDASHPWWMQRMFAKDVHNKRMWFKDQKDGQLYHHMSRDYPELHFVHQLWFDNPRLRYCQIEKVASTQWKNIAFKYYSHISKTHKYTTEHGMVGWTDDTEDAPHAVFLRDPLERFLSAYLDKCGTRDKVAMSHCQPYLLLMQIRKGFASEKQAFDQYVQTLGLMWDNHFPPQALQCKGLFRTLPNYDFVGSMQDDRFVQDLFRLMNRYPGTKLMNLVAKEFNFANPNITNFREELETRTKHQRKPTGSTQKVLQYFDARSVRQLLEYYSIDYVTLNLTIPEWIQGVLDQDCQQEEQLTG